MKRFLLILLATMAFPLLYSADLLEGREWHFTKTWNAAGNLSKLEGGALQVENTGNAGSVTIDCADSELSVKPSTRYLAIVDLEHSASEMKHSLLVTLPGARRVRKPELRTPSEPGNRAAIEFVTRADERRCALYLTLSGTGKTTVKSIRLEEYTPADDLLQRPGINWNLAAAPGESGKLTRLENGTLKIEKNPGPAHVMAYLSLPLEINPSKSYRVTVKARRVSEGARWSIMSHTGSQRPWPAKAAKTTKVGELESAILEVEPAREDNGLRIYAVVRGEGTVEVESVKVEEFMPSSELISTRNWAANPSGSKGKATKLQDGTWEVDKEVDQGAMVFMFHGAFLKVQPGECYRVEWEAKLAPGQRAGSMIYLPRQPKPRAPWPSGKSVASNGTWQTIVQEVQILEGESSMRLHLVINGKAGKAQVRACRLMKIDAEEFKKSSVPAKVEGRVFEKETLKRDWQVFNLREEMPPGDRKGIYYKSYQHSGISCSNLNWKAADVQMIEVAASCDQPCVFRMDFKADDNGKTRTSYLTYISFADGLLHNLRFEVGGNPSWKGIIKEVKITCSATPGIVGFERLHACAKDNLIPFACDARPVSRLENLRPRAEYLLKNAKGATIKILDRDNKAIFQKTADAQEVRFAAPEQTVLGEISGAPANASLTLLRLRPKELPELYWRGEWIWCQNGFGPNNTSVWFEKVIHLDAEPEAAQAVMTADDMLEFFVNGKKVGDGNSHWADCVRFDLTKVLQAGKNRIVAKAHNVGAWGGYIGEVYVRVNGKDYFYPTGTDWNCHIGGETLPQKFELKAFALGAPPAPPWGTRTKYLYIGPKTRLSLVKAGEGKFTIKALDAMPANLDSLRFSVVDSKGESRKIQGIVSPSTGQWKKGEAVEVTLRLPEGNSDVSEIRLAEDFLSVEGNPVIARLVPASKAIPAPSTARIETALGKRPFININGERFNPIYYDGYKLGKEWQLLDAVAGGHRIVRTGTSLDSIWKKPGSYDFSEVDTLLNNFALYAPGVKAILMVKLAMPQWWCDANPDEVIRYDRDQPIRPFQDRQALASKRWLKEATVILRALIQHILKSPHADRVFAIGLSEGWNSEWFWTYSDRFNKSAMSGYSLADYSTFTSYLKEWYGTDEAFARAWGIPGLTFESFSMPTKEEINSASMLTLLDPVKDRKIIDWYRFRNRSIGEAIEHFGKAVKEETGGKWLVGAYYGYFQMFCGIYDRLQSVGHLDVERLSRSPYIDIFWAPSNYNLRRPGLADGIMQAAENLTAHGKLVVVEQDMRTFCENDHYEGGRMRTVELTMGAMDRALGLTLSRGVATHWLSMHDSWFREKVILDLMKQHHKAYSALPPVKGTTPTEICIVSDSQSAFYSKHNKGNNPHLGTVYQLVANFNFVGAPFSHLFVKDLLEPGLIKPHKFYIMTNILSLDQASHDKLMERFNREGATVLWLYAAGISRPDKGPSAELMSEFLGVKCELDNAMRFQEMTLVPELGGKVESNPFQSGPWFLPVSGFDKVLGRSREGKPMLVQWKRGEATHYFSVIMRPSTSLLRTLASQAGVHLYSKSEQDALQVGNDVLFLHAKSTGRKSLHLPAGRRARAIAGPIQGTFTGDFTIDATAVRTYGFLVE